MQELQTSNSQTSEELLSMAEAANQLGITPSALRRWLKKNPDIKEKYTSKQNHLCRVSGLFRRMNVIHKDFLLIIGNVKNFPTSNQHLKRDAQHAFSKTKEKIAKIAISKVSVSQQVMIDMANLMKDLTQELHALRQERIQLPTSQENNPYRLISKKENPGRVNLIYGVKKEKDELTSMCEAIVFRRLGVEYGDSYDNNEFKREIINLRRDMNFQLGRQKVGDYTQKDFEEAKKWLKRPSN